MSIVNIAGYLFTPLDNLEDLRKSLLSLCESLQLKGTILLAEEGTNQMLAGSRQSIDQYTAYLEQEGLFQPIEFKESFSDEQPFQRILVKLKKEIIPFGIDDIDPLNHPAPYLPAQQLKQWLDEGKNLVLLDTRNRYEIDYGTFNDAVDLQIDNFRDFSAAVDAMDPSLKDKTIVTFCTGGIRCEKAAPLMQQKGFKDVYQLDGGILKYFELCGGQHYEGTCFVFDEREALDANLAASQAS